MKMISRRSFTTLTFTIFVATVIFQLLVAPLTSQASAVGFSAGNIISDSKMSDMNAMSESQIRSFINEKNSNCNSNNSLCFRNYKEGGKDTASIIFDASREQRINPQVILVTIQKEQGLITSTNPQQWMYNSAMGYNCPDSTPGRCGSDEQGFLRQVIWGSTMYRAILDGGGNWGNRYANGTRWYTPYIVGMNTVQWNPSLSCGTSQVYIENRATQALYNYTPYRPNNAALNAGYGLGDNCSAYGNRNFFLYMRDWFGYVASPNAYTWSSTSQRIYADTARTQILPYHTVLAPGQTVYAEVKARNTGSVPWVRSNVFFATDRKRDRHSVFYGEGWRDRSRAAQLLEPSVAPGETGTFQFTLTAPQSKGDYKEYFNIVLEGQTWLQDIGFFFPIKVTDTREVQLFSNSSRTAPLPGAKANINEPVYARLRITNTTTTDIPANARIATTNPDDRQSDLRHSSWISADRVTALGKSVAPGHTVNVDFILNPQSDVRVIDEKFGLVIDGVRWVEKGTITVKYSTRERPPNTLQAASQLKAGESLKDSAEKYRLVMQGDGNLVLYSSSRAVWASGTVGSGANRLVMQGDGNLVLYSPSRATWATNTVGR